MFQALQDRLYVDGADTIDGQDAVDVGQPDVLQAVMLDGFDRARL